MEYAAMTFWILVIIFSALGIHHLWSSLIQPKVVNSILLPGTLVATLGHIFGLLVTGGTVNNTTLIKDDDSGEPQTGQDGKTRVPFVGTIIIALLPMAGCTLAIYLVSRYMGSEILTSMSGELSLDHFALPTSLTMLFTMLHQTVNLVEHLVAVVWSNNLTDWRTLLFLYLVVCLTVRMAPLTGNIRGALGAIFIFGILAFLISKVLHAVEGPFQSAWPLITFCVAVLLFLLLLSLLVKGTVGLIKTCFGEG
ncbi:MAG: hypothetical protein ACYTF1_07630 [Planctomycetota bacterium]|jgi:hypothetical protein